MANLLVPTQEIKTVSARVDPVSMPKNVGYQGRSEINEQTQRLNQLADSVFKFAMHHQKLRNEADINHFQNQLKENNMAVLNEFQNLHGKNAGDAQADTQKRLDDFNKSINTQTKDLSPIVQTTIERYSQELSINAGAKMQAHVLNEDFKYDIEERAKAIELDINSAIGDYGTPNELKALEAMDLKIIEQSEKLGYRADDNYTKEAKLDARTKVHYIAIDDLIQDEKFGEARQHLKRVKGDMRAKEYNDLRIRLKDREYNAYSRGQQQKLLERQIKNAASKEFTASQAKAITEQHYQQIKKENPNISDKDAYIQAQTKMLVDQKNFTTAGNIYNRQKNFVYDILSSLEDKGKKFTNLSINDIYKEMVNSGAGTKEEIQYVLSDIKPDVLATIVESYIDKGTIPNDQNYSKLIQMDYDTVMQEFNNSKYFNFSEYLKDTYDISSRQAYKATKFFERTNKDRKFKQAKNQTKDIIRALSNKSSANKLNRQNFEIFFDSIEGDEIRERLYNGEHASVILDDFSDKTRYYNKLYENIDEISTDLYQELKDRNPNLSKAKIFQVYTMMYKNYGEISNDIADFYFFLDILKENGN